MTQSQLTILIQCRKPKLSDADLLNNNKNIYSSKKTWFFNSNFLVSTPRVTVLVRSFKKMTKLLEWLSVLSAVFAIWYSLVGGYVKHPIIEANMTLIAISPILFVIMFGLYAVFIVLYRVFSFNDCLEAAKELHDEILEAKQDLHEKGLLW